MIMTIASTKRFCLLHSGLLAVTLALPLTLTGCFSGEGDRNGGASGDKEKPAEANASRKPLGDTGIIFTFPIDLQKDSIKIRLVGVKDPEITPINPEDQADLGMAVRGLAAGSYDAYITAKARGSSREHAAFIKGINVSRDEFANYNLTHFAPSSTLKGQVRVLGHSQHDKVAVAVNGMPVSGTTDKDGRFTLPFLPEGNYEVTFGRKDLRNGRFSQVTIDQAEVDLGVIAMKRSAEFAGLVTIHEVKPGQGSDQFTLDMVIADTRPDAQFVKFHNADSGFDAIDWRPLRTSIQTPWQKNADNKLYILIGDKNKKVLLKNVKVVQMQPPTPTAP